MIKVPILFNGDYTQGSKGNVEMTDDLAAIYSDDRAQHLMISPILQVMPGGKREVIAFGVYPMPAEPAQPPKKKRRKRAKDD